MHKNYYIFNFTIKFFIIDSSRRIFFTYTSCINKFQINFFNLIHKSIYDTFSFCIFYQIICNSFNILLFYYTNYFIFLVRPYATFFHRLNYVIINTGIASVLRDHHPLISLVKLKTSPVIISKSVCKKSRSIHHSLRNCQVCLFKI